MDTNWFFYNDNIIIKLPFGSTILVNTHKCLSFLADRGIQFRPNAKLLNKEITKIPTSYIETP